MSRNWRIVGYEIQLILLQIPKIGVFLPKEHHRKQQQDVRVSKLVDTAPLKNERELTFFLSSSSESVYIAGNQNR
jgi:hypothetical protein